MKTIRVAVVDLNSARRNVLKDLINQSADIECLAVFSDWNFARDKLGDLHPDVVMLDEKILRVAESALPMLPGTNRPTPFVRIPPLEERFLLAEINKDRPLTPFGLPAYGEVICKKIRIALQGPVVSPLSLDILPSVSADAILPKQFKKLGKTETVIIVGASTGGTEALKEFLIPFPASSPAILIAQHMPEMFTKSFAARLDSFCKVTVKEAEHGERVLPGHVYIAPGHSHLMLGWSSGHYVCELSQGTPVNRHRPSVDVLFRSAANVAGRNALGVILTGMGKDGASGMLEMKQAGAYNFAQDEASCVVFGMPKEAIALGGADEVLSLRDIAPRILMWMSQPRVVF